MEHRVTPLHPPGQLLGIARARSLRVTGRGMEGERPGGFQGRVLHMVLRLSLYFPVGKSSQ